LYYQDLAFDIIKTAKVIKDILPMQNVKDLECCYLQMDVWNMKDFGRMTNVKDKDLKPLGTHFAGNFWWSTGKYFLSLPKKIESGYCDPESYIFLKDPKYLALDEDKAPKNTDFYRTHIYPIIFLGERVG
jgi:hypothetical protein